MRELVTADELYGLIQPDNFVGWVYSLDYDNALIITNDAWKNNVKGIKRRYKENGKYIK